GYYLLQGNCDKLEQLLKAHGDSFQGSGFIGSAFFMHGRVEEALEAFEQDLALLNKYAGPEGSFFFNTTGLFCIMALLARNAPGDHKLIRQATALVLGGCQGCAEEIPFRFFDAYTRAVDGNMPDMRVLTERFEQEKRSLSTLTVVLALYWIGVEIPDKFQKSLLSVHQKAKENGFLWLAMESAGLLAALDPKYEEMSSYAILLNRQLGCSSIVHIITPDKDSWKQSLQELITVTSRSRRPEKTSRLSWMVDFNGTQLNLSAKEQKKKSAGSWSKGRGIGLNRLMVTEHFDFFSEQDIKICAALSQTGDVNARNGGCEFNMEKALPVLVGHPLVFLEKSSHVPVEIVAGEPELMVEEQDGDLFIHFLQDIGVGKVAVWQETPTRFRVMEINDEHRRVAGIIGGCKGLRLPAAASSQ
ncbi:MAG: ATP-dependent helicase, partial [Candidatus Electrothrix sp. AR3]|nr:ATP-dependent helicase [Candidatus Electrothrix sp. AR3]